MHVSPVIQVSPAILTGAADAKANSSDHRHLFRSWWLLLVVVVVVFVEVGEDDPDLVAS